ncbi:MAG: glucose-6-phosphate isomerase [Prevotellaceae bacterium]|jgi:glucose-6-phosphate isomerase|nr:glucose-6-phosphate isomerase [Prevotellaceae bacterium]
MSSFTFDPGIDIRPNPLESDFIYGEDVFGPKVENRRLDDIRSSLNDSSCNGPEIVYSIAMDVGKKKDREILITQDLLFGVVRYSEGKLGNTPVRSQGHSHKVSPLSGWSTPEVYEIWSGKAIIYMQEFGEEHPGRCYAVEAFAGDVVIVPPLWIHATISADPAQALVFGAWCVRDYGFDYDKVRQRRGIAWYPEYNNENHIVWRPNIHYSRSNLICKTPADYTAFGLSKGKSIYSTFESSPQTFLYVPHPETRQELWHEFEP